MQMVSKKTGKQKMNNIAVHISKEVLCARSLLRPDFHIKRFGFSL